jgi:hypothetical protein
MPINKYFIFFYDFFYETRGLPFWPPVRGKTRGKNDLERTAASYAPRFKKFVSGARRVYRIIGKKCFRVGNTVFFETFLLTRR